MTERPKKDGASKEHAAALMAKMQKNLDNSKKAAVKRMKIGLKAILDRHTPIELSLDSL